MIPPDNLIVIRFRFKISEKYSKKSYDEIYSYSVINGSGVSEFILECQNLVAHNLTRMIETGEISSMNNPKYPDTDFANLLKFVVQYSVAIGRD